MGSTRGRIHQQDFFTFHRQPDAQILTGGAFPHTAFLIGDCDNRSFLCDNITPLSVNRTQSRGSFCSDRRGLWWWAHCRALPADTASCSAPGRCFLPDSPARNGCEQRLQYQILDSENQMLANISVSVATNASSCSFVRFGHPLGCFPARRSFLFS